MADLKRILAQYVSGPLFLLIGLGLGYAWMFAGYEESGTSPAKRRIPVIFIGQ